MLILPPPAIPFFFGRNVFDFAPHPCTPRLQYDMDMAAFPTEL